MCSYYSYIEYQDLDILEKIIVWMIHINSSLLKFIFRYFWQQLRLMRWNITFSKGHVANIKENKRKKWLLKSHTNIKRNERSDYREKIKKRTNRPWICLNRHFKKRFSTPIFSQQLKIINLDFLHFYILVSCFFTFLCKKFNCNYNFWNCK